MKTELFLSTAIAVAFIAPAGAQQGFNSGGLNTCSVIQNPNLLPISTCYGYINGTPTFFTQQPAGSALPLNFDNFVGQTGHTPAPIAISPSGVPTFSNAVLANNTLSGSIYIAPSATMYPQGTIFATGSVAVPPAFAMGIGPLTGALGNGGAVRLPALDVNNFVINGDSLNLENAAGPVGWRYQYNVGPAVGGRIGSFLTMNQKGSLTADGNHQPSFVGYTEALYASYPMGSGTFAAPTGALYGTNVEINMNAGATGYAISNTGGEYDTVVAPSSATVVVGGSVATGGETIEALINGTEDILGTNVTINVTAEYVAFAGDTPAIVVEGLAGSIQGNVLNLTQYDVGANPPGALNVLSANTLTVSYPQWGTNFTVTPSIVGSTGLTIATSGTTVGASTASKFGMSWVSQRGDGSAGWKDDGLFYLGRQGGYSSGGWRCFVCSGGVAKFGGPQNDPSTVDGAQWPWNPTAVLFQAFPATRAGNGNATPLVYPQLGGVFAYSNVAFNGPPLSFPGFQENPDGSVYVGSAGIARIYGASAPGVALSAGGYEGSSLSVISAGGPGAGTLTNRYYVGDVVTCGYGDFEAVTGITSTGGIATITPGTNTMGETLWPSSPPGITEPSTTCNLGNTSGSGTGAVLGIVWTQGTVVAIGASGQTVNLIGTIESQGTVGVSCTGTLSVSAVVVHGIVTHC